LKLYPHSTEEEVERSATDLASENFISYSTWKWFDLHRENSGQPVYRYLFSRIRPPLKDKDLVSGLAGGTQKKQNPQQKMPQPIGASHASEIEYCLGNLYLVNDYQWTADDYKVSKTMQDFFANFIINGNPNGTGLPQWNAAKPGDKTPDIMVIDVDSKDVKATDDVKFRVLDKKFSE
jgi:para-nitrobenzyl esterase